MRDGVEDEIVVGMIDGLIVGPEVGAADDGTTVGAMVLGKIDGLIVGRTIGAADVGYAVGEVGA